MEDYFIVLKQLLPPGKFFDLKPKSAFAQLLQGLSLELNRVRDLMNNRFCYGNYPERNGSLSRAYVEHRLQLQGFSNFEMNDPSEEDLGLVDEISPQMLGIIFIKKEIQTSCDLTAGFLAGDPIRNWFDFEFEKAVKQLKPAHIRAKFLYYEKENINVTT